MGVVIDKCLDLSEDIESMDNKELEKLIGELNKKMHRAAADLNFEQAAILRDEITKIRKMMDNNG